MPNQNIGRRSLRAKELIRQLQAMIVTSSNRSNIGLAFVPNVVDNLEHLGFQLPEVNLALIILEREKLIELRPDSGLGRFTQRELDSAPPGPQGSRLLWARPIDQRSHGVDDA